jgi:hypothetical protein
MRKVAVVVLLVACSKHPLEWKVQKGPGFSVDAPALTRMVHGEDVGMPGITAFHFGPDVDFGMQVDLVQLTPTQDPATMIGIMRDKAATGASISTEETVNMGDVAGKDLRVFADVPKAGKVQIRMRLVAHDHTIYKVIFMEKQGLSHAADGDRFVDSFKLE